MRPRPEYGLAAAFSKEGRCTGMGIWGERGEVEREVGKT